MNHRSGLRVFDRKYRDATVEKTHPAFANENFLLLFFNDELRNTFLHLLSCDFFLVKVDIQKRRESLCPRVESEIVHCDLLGGELEIESTAIVIEQTKESLSRFRRLAILTRCVKKKKYLLP